MVLSKHYMTRFNSKDSSRGMSPDILILTKWRNFTSEFAQSMHVLSAVKGVSTHD